MREVRFEDGETHFADLIAEAEAGGSLTIVKSGRAVARIVPVRDLHAEELTQEERQAARTEVRQMTERGWDLGITWNGRDELYDRD